MKRILTAILAILNATFFFAQQTPAPAQNETITVQGATIHTGNKTVIENGVIVFSKGIITKIGKTGSMQPEGKVINASGKHIYPGFIIPNTTLGLGEIDAVKASLDYDETGNYLPHVRSIISYNAESQVVESMRPNGVLLAQITPRGGIISGESSVVQLDAWNWEDAVVKTDDGIHLNWPSNFRRANHGFGRSDFSKINKDYSKSVKKITDYFTQAKAYNEKSNGSKNLPFESLRGIFSGNKNLYIHLKLEKEIIDAIDFAKQLEIKNIVLVGAGEAYKTIPLLKQTRTPVLLQRVHLLPDREDDDYDLPYKMAALLYKEGVLVALEGSGQMERMNARNLPFYAGTVTRFGLSDEEALQLITKNTALILGIDQRYGTLETGKSATFFISDGNPLDMRTNNLNAAFIDGRQISLKTHQTELYERYKKKYAK